MTLQFNKFKEAINRCFEEQEKVGEKKALNEDTIDSLTDEFLKDYKEEDFIKFCDVKKLTRTECMWVWAELRRRGHLKESKLYEFVSVDLSGCINGDEVYRIDVDGFPEKDIKGKIINAIDDKNVLVRWFEGGVLSKPVKIAKEDLVLVSKVKESKLKANETLLEKTKLVEAEGLNNYLLLRRPRFYSRTSLRIKVWIEEFLKRTDIKKNPDGSYDVEGDVSCFDLGSKLPVKFGKVGGDFYCGYNKLISLEGAPKEVGGYFNCSGNRITSLKGGPKEVGRDFYCYSNKLTSLEGAPKEVGGDFYCRPNPRKFTEEEVRAVSNVGGNVKTLEEEGLTEKEVSEKIVKLPDGKYQVQSEKGKNMGTYGTNRGNKDLLEKTKLVEEESNDEDNKDNLVGPSELEDPVIEDITSGIEDPDVEKPIPSLGEEKEYLGSRNQDEYFYLKTKYTVEGAIDNLLLVDASDLVLLDAKKDNIDISNPINFILEVITKENMTLVSVDIIQKYIILPLEKKEKEEKEEQTVEEEVPEDITPKEEDLNAIRSPEAPLIKEQPSFEAVYKESMSKYLNENSPGQITRWATMSTEDVMKELKAGLETIKGGGMLEPLARSIVSSPGLLRIMAEYYTAKRKSSTRESTNEKIKSKLTDESSLKENMGGREEVSKDEEEKISAYFAKMRKDGLSSSDALMATGEQFDVSWGVICKLVGLPESKSWEKARKEKSSNESANEKIKSKQMDESSDDYTDRDKAEQIIVRHRNLAGKDSHISELDYNPDGFWFVRFTDGSSDEYGVAELEDFDLAESKIKEKKVCVSWKRDDDKRESKWFDNREAAEDYASQLKKEYGYDAKIDESKIREGFIGKAVVYQGEVSKFKEQLGRIISHEESGNFTIEFKDGRVTEVPAKDFRMVGEPKINEMGEELLATRKKGAGMQGLITHLNKAVQAKDFRMVGESKINEMEVSTEDLKKIIGDDKFKKLFKDGHPSAWVTQKIGEFDVEWNPTAGKFFIGWRHRGTSESYGQEIDYSSFADEKGLTGKQKELFVKYMETRWPKSGPKYDRSYAATWLERFRREEEYVYSDGEGRAILKNIDKEKYGKIKESLFAI
jgi:hypothetical protein